MRQLTPMVMVVEDDFLLALHIQEVLEAAAFSVVGPCPSGELALQLAEKIRPDIVLMDIQVAGSMDGLSTAAEMWDKLGIRSIFVTAQTDLARSERGMAANPIAIIGKPYTDNEIIQALHAALPDEKRPAGPAPEPRATDDIGRFKKSDGKAGR